MDPDAIRGERLSRQHLLDEQYPDVATAVGHLTAVQAQEFNDACRMVSRRVVGNPALSTIADQGATGDVVRTHVLRPTRHFVRAVDLDWLLDLTAERVHAQMRPHYRSAGFEHDRDRAVGLITDILVAATEPLTGQELGVRHGERGLTITGTPLSQLTLALNSTRSPSPVRGVGPRTRSSRTDRGSRSPRNSAVRKRWPGWHVATWRATRPDGHRGFAWWSGLTLADARAGFTAAGAIQHDHGLFSTGEVPGICRGNGASAVDLRRIRDRLCRPIGAVRSG